jgi:DNA helicase-2/ATP-dependent DNA helicase PcrA
VDLAKLLNPQQLEGAQTTEGPVLILAGAGSGKTRVITYRVAHLIEGLGVRPEQILAVTFTNKAADQMKTRVRNLLRGPRSGDPLISTFHSLCVRILRREIEALTYTRDFTIYDESDQLQVVKAAMKDLKVDDRLVTAKTIQSRISHAKNHGKTAQNLLDDSWDPSWEFTANVFNEYEKRLKKSNALDFDDLLIKTVDLFDKFPAVAEKYSTRFQYVMVDEYQDTNRQQYRLVRHLTRVHDNICVVGDEDQSIYSWRGADIQNILSFEKDFLQLARRGHTEHFVVREGLPAGSHDQTRAELPVDEKHSGRSQRRCRQQRNAQRQVAVDTESLGRSHHLHGSFRCGSGGDVRRRTPSVPPESGSRRAPGRFVPHEFHLAHS